MIDSMNETERSNLSIRDAMLSRAGRLHHELPPQAQAAASSATLGQAPQASAPSAPAAPLGFKSSIRRALRPAAAVFYRMAKPLLRPPAFRLRAYLLAPLLAELQRFERATQEQFRSELHHLRSEQARAVERQQDELASVGLQMLQELDSVRDIVARTVRASAPDPALLRASSDALRRVEQYALAAARRMAVPGAPGEVLVRTSVGYVLCAASDYPLLSTLIDVGELEIGTRLLIQRLLRPGDTFVDVGANVGMHTLGAARAMEGSGRIVAFEPHPITHALLGKSLLLNGFAGLAETYQAAVSNRTGRMPLHLGLSSGHHSLYPLEGESPTAATVEVPLVRLDDVIAGSSVDLIKIDVEGAELDVLEGASATLARNPEIALIVEYGGSHLRRTGNSSSNWFEAFEAQGFNFRAIEPATGVLLDWSLTQLESLESINLLFARPTSSAWARAQGET